MENKSILKLFALNNLSKVVFLAYAFMIDYKDRKFVDSREDDPFSSILGRKWAKILVCLAIIISFLLELIISFISYLIGTTKMSKIIFWIFFIGQIFLIIMD